MYIDYVLYKNTVYVRCNKTDVNGTTNADMTESRFGYSNKNIRSQPDAQLN